MSLSEINQHPVFGTNCSSRTSRRVPVEERGKIEEEDKKEREQENRGRGRERC